MIAQVKKFACTHCGAVMVDTVCDYHGDPHDGCPEGVGRWYLEGWVDREGPLQPHLSDTESDD